MSSKIKSRNAWAVLGALNYVDNKMTYAQIASTIGASYNTVKNGVSELVVSGMIKVFQDTGSRTLLVELITFPQRNTDSLVNRCITANEYSESDSPFLFLNSEKWEVIQAIWEDIFSVEQWGTSWRVRALAEKQLALVDGDIHLLYEKLQPVKNNLAKVRSPGEYMLGTLRGNGERKVSRSSSGTTATVSNKVFKPELTNEVEITPDMWKLVESGKKQFGDKKAV